MFDPIVSSYRDKKKKKKERKKEGRGTELSSCPSVSRWRGIVLKERSNETVSRQIESIGKKEKSTCQFLALLYPALRCQSLPLTLGLVGEKGKNQGQRNCLKQSWTIVFGNLSLSSFFRLIRHRPRVTVLFKFTFSIDNPWKLSNM